MKGAFHLANDQMEPSRISAAEIAEINERIYEMSRTNPKILYGREQDEGPSMRRLTAIVESIPGGEVVDQAAWLLRAIILVQPFPDANHRTAMAAATLLIEREGMGFDPPVHEAEEFQRAVSSARFQLLGGYDDAPLAVLDSADDPVLSICRVFVERHLTKRL